MSGRGEPETSDEVLVLAARRGDERALEELLRRHEGRVLRVLRLMGVPLQDREDVAQEVFVRIFRHLGGFRTGTPFHSWVYRIAVNAAHDYRAGERRRAWDTPWDEGLEIPDPASGPEKAAEGIDLRDRLLRALSVLTRRERAVFVLKELEGLETREVARTLRIAAVTVRRHLGRARRRLERALRQRDGKDFSEKGGRG